MKSVDLRMFFQAIPSRKTEQPSATNWIIHMPLATNGTEEQPKGVVLAKSGNGMAMAMSHVLDVFCGVLFSI